ncbi:hypothetical protein PSTG_08198 [Puccinia striiformis f. sp. tritici PST-78]|uniref:Uncharacterized protein n=1 Tax=Puccinia striiformis f. sp. tritici PST-78 TaxID=1165861 RepID=A0A0L0VHL9_9BASI|nr:hypothetical protein PSTG_08198 [Puccinia striiformis f. sp. tritici PST-78]
MADSETKQADEQEPQRLVEQGDLIIQEFGKLIDRYNDTIDLHQNRVTIEEAMSSLSINEDGLKDMFPDSLQLILQHLKSHIIGLLRTPDPSNSHSQQATELKFKCISDNQPKVEWIMERIRYLVVVFYPEPTTARVRTDDQHLRRLKSCRLRSLRSTFLEACRLICRSFGAAIELVKLMKLKESPEQFKRLSQEHRRLTYHVKMAALLVDSTIESIEGSDWDLAVKSWQVEFEGNQDLLKSMMTLIEPETDILETGDRESVAKYVREPVIHLAKLLIPIMKLSRLFFNKISVRGINTKRLPLFTEMCSEQIESLAMSHGSVSSSFVHILSLLDAADRAPGVVPHVHFIGSVRCLKNIFEAPLLIVLLYLVPAIPDTDGFPIQNYYKNWLITWNTQRILATENFINIFTRSSVVDPELL